MPIVKLPTGPKLAMSTMAIIRVGGDYADADFALLGRHLKLLDIEICRINAAIVSSRVLIPREAAPSFRNDAAPLFRELLAP